MSREVMDLGSDELKELIVKIGSRHYLVEEAHGEAAVAYRRTMMAGAKFEEDPNDKAQGKKKKKNLQIREVPTGTAELPPVLVTHCMYCCTYNPTTEIVEKGERVTEQFVRGLPERILKPIYDWIKKNSDLDEGEDDADPLPEQTSGQKS